MSRPMIVADTDALVAVRNLLHANPAHFLQLGATPPRALLLSGPPGIGKTHAVRIAAQQAAIPITVISPGPDVHLRLKEAFASSPQQRINFPETSSEVLRRIVFIDEIDSICPNQTSSSSRQTSNRATCFLLALMNTSNYNQNTSDHQNSCFIYVIAATNRPNAIDPRLRTPGRFEREVNLLPPTSSQRYAILRSLEPSINDATLRNIADHASGFVAADLAAICTEARSFAKYSSVSVQNAQPSSEDILNAFYRATPSVLRDAFAAEVPNCSWDEIGGVAEVKKRLKMAVEWPLRYSSTFSRLGLKAPRGILLHGPPGCSKTTLVRAAACQSHVAFLRLNGADIFSCYLGEAERILRQAFASARAAAPCILFLDELDAIVGKRSTGGGQTDGNGVQERVLSTLLTEMDGVVSASGVLVIGATNRLDLLDDALIRPGRFDDVLKVDLPDEQSRLEILRIHSSGLPLASDIDLSEIAKVTSGRSGADLKSLCSEAGLAALRARLMSGSPHTNGSLADRDLQIRREHFVL